MPRIKALSLHPGILCKSHGRCGSEENGISSIWSLLTEYSSLEELEICPNIDEVDDDSELSKS